jgi:hypothetical protein
MRVSRTRLPLKQSQRKSCHKIQNNESSKATRNKSRSEESCFIKKTFRLCNFNKQISEVVCQRRKKKERANNFHTIQQCNV